MERIAPSFRKACDRFPVLAESIAKANGLDTAEFNRFGKKIERIWSKFLPHAYTMWGLLSTENTW